MATKMDKDELLEPDKLQIFFLNLRSFVEKHRMRIFAGAGIFVLMMLLTGFWYLYHLNYETTAAKQYNHVSDTAAKSASTDRDASAIKGYKDLIIKYPKSDAAVTASYRLGNLHLSRGEIDAAIGAYHDFLKKAPPRSDLITLAYTGLGGCYETKRDFNKALEFYEKAIKTNTASSFESLNYTNIARIYEVMNQPAKASESYKKALDKTTDPLMQLFLKRKISTLG
jgi:tetratricopeptide (TPR) repeat protein